MVCLNRPCHFTTNVTGSILEYIVPSVSFKKSVYMTRLKWHVCMSIILMVYFFHKFIGLPERLQKEVATCFPDSITVKVSWNLDGRI